jgi:hypothetical protein
MTKCRARTQESRRRSQSTDLLEDLLNETQAVTTPVGVLEPAPRSLSDPVNAEVEEKKEDPLYTEIPLPATNSV